MSRASAGDIGLGGAESYRIRRLRRLCRRRARGERVHQLSNRPGIGFEGQAALYRIMRELAGI
jgi:hypothetical protein